jgi:hypothetical protein
LVILKEGMQEIYYVVARELEVPQTMALWQQMKQVLEKLLQTVTLK